MSEGGAEWCGEGKRSMWLEGVHGQSLDAFTVQSGWERVCGRVVLGGGPGPATIQGHASNLTFSFPSSKLLRTGRNRADLNNK